MGRLNKKDREWGAGGRNTPICARKLEILEGDKSDGCSKDTSLYITCLVTFIFLADMMLAVVWYAAHNL